MPLANLALNLHASSCRVGTAKGDEHATPASGLASKLVLKLKSGESAVRPGPCLLKLGKARECYESL